MIRRYIFPVLAITVFGVAVHLASPSSAVAQDYTSDDNSSSSSYNSNNSGIDYTSGTSVSNGRYRDRGPTITSDMMQQMSDANQQANADRAQQLSDQIAENARKQQALLEQQRNAQNQGGDTPGTSNNVKKVYSTKKPASDQVRLFNTF